MGTRSLTVFKDEQDQEICVLYRQMDGYPEGHGKELRDFLRGFHIVNGIRDYHSKVANGMGCLTAQAIAHFKTEIGGFYLYPAGTRDCGEEYIYTVSYNKNSSNFNIRLKMEEVGGISAYQYWTY